MAESLNLEVLAFSGATLQSICVPSTLLGRELLALVVGHSAIEGKLLHRHVLVNASRSLAAQGITDGSQLTLVRVISTEQQEALVRKMCINGNIAVWLYGVLSDDELAIWQSITEMVWEDGSLDHLPLPCRLRSLTFGMHFNQSLDKVTLPDGHRFGVVAAPHGNAISSPLPPPLVGKSCTRVGSDRVEAGRGGKSELV